MGVPEPAHLVGVVKTCPHADCGSTLVKWRYYNNNQIRQPRYRCLRCNRLFTYGGKIYAAKIKDVQVEEKAPLIRLRLIGGAVINLWPASKVKVGAGASPEWMQQGEAGPESGLTGSQSLGADYELVASSETEANDHLSSGGWEPWAPDSARVASSESGVTDHFASGGSESELDSEELVITGPANSRSWECLFS